MRDFNAEGALKARVPCTVCGRETTRDPAMFGTHCLRLRMVAGSMAAEECFRIGYWRARTLLNTVRALIDEDTSFPGAVLRVEIDKVLGSGVDVLP